MAPDDNQHSVEQPRLLRNMSGAIRNELIAGISEFIGTFMFLFVPYVAVQVASDAPALVAPPAPATGPVPIVVTDSPQSIRLLYIAFAFGFSLLVNAWIFFRISGSMFNPAITFALFLNKTVSPQRAVIVLVAQLVAAICAAAVAHGVTPGPVQFATRLDNGESTVQGLFLEAFLTFQLVLAVFFLAVEKHRATPLAPVGIGLALFIAHLACIHYTGAGINPARSFGPDVIMGSFPHYHWIYWLGPFMGAALAFLVYTLMRLLAYESANAGQDSIGAAACPYAAVDSPPLVAAPSGSPGAAETGLDGAHRTDSSSAPLVR